MSVPIPAIIRLDPSKRKGLPRGWEGEIRSGYEFYRMEGKSLHFITIEFGPDPILIAVTEEQVRVWKDAIAIPMQRKYLNGLWTEMPPEGTI